MTTREYGQYCGLTRALEIVGERWALLIVRDLLVGPRRYTDLRRGLPRIPTNILAVRLKELEGAGVVRRRVLARPEGSIVYELTEFGSELEDAVICLGRWGAQVLGDPRPGEIMTNDSLVMAMRTTFNPEAAKGVNVRYELRLGEPILGVSIDDGVLTVSVGPLSDPDLVIETGSALKALLAAEISPAEAVATGAVTLTGDSDLLDLFVDVFQIKTRSLSVR